MRHAVLLAVALGACTPDAAPPQDPRCPAGWSYTLDNVGRCSAPEGYTALLYAQFGGSGIYGFGRLTTACPDGSAGDPACGVSLIGGMPVALYAMGDVHGTTIDPGAQPVLAVTSSTGGVFKGPIGAGTYWVACRDPVTLETIVTGSTDVKPDTLALYAIDIEHLDTTGPESGP